MTRFITPEHKQAMRDGRQASATVDAYLRAIGRPKARGRRVSVEELRQRQTTALSEAATTAGVAKLKLIQKAQDLGARIEAAEATETVDIEALEHAFVSVAGAYGQSHNIGYVSWREVGVPAAVLRAAGIKETRKRRQT